MTSFTKRTALRALAAAILFAGATGAASAADREIRIGYQKYGTLVLLKGKGTLEAKLKALGVTVKWAEFQFGPPLLEAVNAGALDFGTTGEAPPVFAQAAGPRVTYVANEPPAPHAEALLVPQNSPIKSVAELKGKKVAVAKGSNAHYLLVKALEKAGLAYSDVEVVYLAPADGRSAFERGAVDAWSVWDPFYAAAEVGGAKARVLADGEGVVSNHQFFLADRAYAEKNQDIIKAVLAELRSVEDWVQKDPKAAAQELSPAVGIPVPILEKAIARQGFGVRSITPETVAQQQKIADAFYALKLIPKEIKVSDAVVEVTQ